MSPATGAWASSSPRSARASSISLSAASSSATGVGAGASPPPAVQELDGGLFAQISICRNTFPGRL
jgi:hypothetical protein